jgi:putative drug exporter of the RND superfamily
MSAFLARIAHALAAHWGRGLIGLVVVILAVGAAVAGGGGTSQGDFSIPGTESQKALDLLEAKFPSAAGATSQIVYTTTSGKLTDPQQAKAIADSLGAVKKLEGVTQTEANANPKVPTKVSSNGQTAFWTIQYDTQPTDITTEQGKDFIKAAETGDQNGVQVEMRGPVVDQGSQSDAPIGELVGIFIAIVLLTILFRSWAAMLTTLVGAIIGVAISQMILAAISAPLGIPDFASQLAVMLGLGAGIDYALLIVSRFREQLVKGDSVPDAAGRANATSGTSVVAAGLIVVVAIAGLLTIGIPLVGKMGIGAAIAVAAVVVSSITVLPIFMGMLAKWLHPKDPEHVAESQAFASWGRRLVARPWVAVIGGGLVLIIIAIPFTSMRLGQPDDGNQPEKMTQRKAYDELSSAFGPGFNGPLLLAIGTSGDAKLQPAPIAKLEDALKAAPNVASVSAAVPNKTGDAAIINVIPKTSPQDQATSDLVDQLRDKTIPAAVAGSDLQVYVGGQTAGFEDFSAKVSSRLPLFIAVVIGLSILLLIAVFRSILVPLASAVFNLLSIGAAYGVVVAVFQKGWGASLIGASSDVPIVSFIPLMMFAVLFGLSMDYNVFLLSRIREAYFEGDSPKESVVHGLSRIAKVILTAGLIMASVFLAFASGSDTIVKMFGIGLGSAILIDVLIVRMIVSPALMVLLGDKAWWMPKWLDKILPNVSLEGGHDTRAEHVERRETAGV